jgi:hypothetical protein
MFLANSIVSDAIGQALSRTRYGAELARGFAVISRGACRPVALEPDARLLKVSAFLPIPGITPISPR